MKRAQKGAFDLSEAAEYVGVSMPTMATWARREDFPAIRAGRRWVIPKNALDEWLKEQAARRAEIGTK